MRNLQESQFPHSNTDSICDVFSIISVISINYFNEVILSWCKWASLVPILQQLWLEWYMEDEFNELLFVTLTHFLKRVYMPWCVSCSFSCLKTVLLLLVIGTTEVPLVMPSLCSQILPEYIKPCWLVIWLRVLRPCWMNGERGKPHIVKIHLLPLVPFCRARSFNLFLTFICGFDHSENAIYCTPLGKSLCQPTN